MTTLDFNSAECHALSVDSVLRDLKVDPASGLPDNEAGLRLEQAGANELTGRTGRTAAAILCEQFKNPLIWLLLGAAVASIVVGEIVEVVAILAIVILNGALGFFQDFKAETALASLRKLSEPNATVLRNGEWIRIPAPEVTLGDIIRLEAGNRVTADGRVIESAHLQIDEASLTGESMPVTKQIEELPRDTSLADRLNCVYTGTTVASGRGTAVVVAVGMATDSDGLQACCKV